MAGDHYDDFTENLPTAQEQGQDEHASEGVKNEDATTETVDQPSSTPVFSAAVASVNPAHRVTTPQGVYGKLWYGVYTLIPTLLSVQVNCVAIVLIIDPFLFGL